MMEKRPYKNTGTEISLLGFGCMRLPRVGTTQKIDRTEAQKMIDYAYDHGVNYFDTAWPYHAGDSELFIGEALKKYPRDSFHLASKLPLWELREPSDVKRIFEKQLEKCQVDYFDFYLEHNINTEFQSLSEKADAHAQLAALKKEGKIRHHGFSFHDTADFLEQIVDQYDYDFAQIQLNYLDWDQQDAQRKYEILTQRGIPVIIMEPVRGGTLATLRPESVEIFKKADPDASVASWAIRFAASLPNVLTVLSGMSTMEQVVDNVATMTNFRPLSQADHGTVTAAVTAYRATGAIPCTACRYCMDCPSGVDIPKVFAYYNNYKVKGKKASFLDEYELLGDGAQAHQCIACNQCTEHCPQFIDIPKWMQEISAFTSAD
ncbi:MAG: aldo/keto reductase [Christensenellales bacterium]|jgi:predicted aldo/keto reductase-like oxidoreductase